MPPAPQLDHWLASAEGRAAGADPDRGRYLRERVKGGVHDAAIHSFCLWFDKPFTWDGLNAALAALTALRGPDLLRVKGLVNVEGEAGPVVLQGAQHVFHPPVRMQAWSGGERRSRIVFIVRGIPRAAVEALFAAVCGLG